MSVRRSPTTPHTDGRSGGPGGIQYTCSVILDSTLIGPPGGSILPAPHSLERVACGRVEAVAQLPRPLFAVRRLLEIAEERLRRELLHLLAGRAPNSRVGRDEDDVLAA